MTVLTKFEFASAGTRGKYDWSKLTDGKIYKLVRGTDYTAKYIGAQIRVYAAKHGLTVNVSRGNPDNDHVVLQFIKPTKATKKSSKKTETPVNVESLVNEIVAGTNE